MSRPGTVRRSIDEIRLLGGHPVLDFVNTLDSRIGRQGPDYLACPKDYIDWSLRVGLLTGSEHVTLAREISENQTEAMKELKRARELREAIHRLCLTEVSHNPPMQADLKDISETASSTGEGKALKWADGRFSLETEIRSLRDLSRGIAQMAVEFLTQGDRRAIRQCPGDNCGWLFIDTSRGGRRKWCADASCGTHSRVKKFRAAREVGLSK